MQIQYIFELFGTLVFAISGALAANKKNPDWFGVAFLAFLTAVGGGSLRDVLLGNYPLVWVEDISFLISILTGVILTGIFFNYFNKLRRTLFLFDTVGIALFTIAGVEKVLAMGMNPLISALMGMFSAVMGGVIRDTIMGKVPIILQKEIYATACLAGAVLYLTLDYFELNRTVNFLISGLLIVSIRIVSVIYNLSLPKFGEERDS